MNAMIDLIRQRVSCPRLSGRALSKSELEAVLACGMRAPDHGRLKPWHFHVVEGEARQRLGALFAQTARDSGVASAAKITKCENMPLRAPMLIIATCEPVENTKVPSIDQVLAVGAAIQNMQIAISSLGMGSIWRTGEMVDSKCVKKSLGLSENGSIVGFVYIGEPEKLPDSPSLDADAHFSIWEGL